MGGANEILSWCDARLARLGVHQPSSLSLGQLARSVRMLLAGGEIGAVHDARGTPALPAVCRDEPSEPANGGSVLGRLAGLFRPSSKKADEQSAELAAITSQQPVSVDLFSTSE